MALGFQKPQFKRQKILTQCVGFFLFSLAASIDLITFKSHIKTPKGIIASWFIITIFIYAIILF